MRWHGSIDRHNWSKLLGVTMVLFAAEHGTKPDIFSVTTCQTLATNPAYQDPNQNHTLLFAAVATTTSEHSSGACVNIPPAHTSLF